VSETQPNQGYLFSPLLLTWWVGGWVSGGGGWGGLVGVPKLSADSGESEKHSHSDVGKEEDKINLIIKFRTKIQIKLNIPTSMLGLESETQAKGYFIFTSTMVGSTLATLTLIILFCVKNVENFTPEKK
jgi:hypothetical protein